MAAPYVAGTVAQLLQQGGGWMPPHLIRAIRTMRSLSKSLILTVVCAGSVVAQSSDTIAAKVHAPRPIASAIAGGILGSGLGMVGGGLIAGQTVDCNYRYSETSFCGLGEAVVGMLVGSTVGAGLGAYVGARLGNGSPSKVRTALAAVVGAGTGILAGMLVDSLIEADISGFIAFPVTQGAVAGVAAALWK